MNKLAKMKDKTSQRRYLKKLGYSESQIPPLLDKARFLQKGLKKFPRAALMQYTEDTIAQASSLDVAMYRTWKVHSKLQKVQFSVDLCGGIGGDAIAAGLRWKVIVVEKNQSIFDMLEHNLNVYNVQNNVRPIFGDIYDLLLQPEFQEKIKEADFIFFDPSRRNEETRTVKIEEYKPPLSLIDEILPLNANVCVKISPGVDILHISYNCDVEIVSLKGEVKEVTLWFGDLMRSPTTRNVIATKLPEKVTLQKSIDKYEEIMSELISVPQKYLYEPDPAAIKAHLINELATDLNLHILHPQVAYLTSDKYVYSPWLKCYQVLDTCPIDIPRIKNILKSQDIHRIDCKARGLSLDLHAIQKELSSKGRNIGLVIFTWANHQKIAIIAQYVWDFSRKNPREK